MPIEPPAGDLVSRFRRIELLVLDVDGVLTDGIIVVDDRGVESKHFFVRDGSAINLWRQAGHRVAILSGRWAPVVDRRASELGIAPVIQGARDKEKPFRDLLDQLDLDPSQAAYMGDDLPDLPVLRIAGLAACPADAAAEVCQAAHFVTGASGGRGAVRELIEQILKAQGHWEKLVTNDQPSS